LQTILKIAKLIKM